MRRCRREDDRESVRQEIEYNLQRIQEDLLRGFLVVPLRDDNGIWTAAIVTADKDITIVPGGCPSGSYKDETARICSKYVIDRVSFGLRVFPLDNASVILWDL